MGDVPMQTNEFLSACTGLKLCISLASARAKEDQRTKHVWLSKAIDKAQEAYLKESERIAERFGQ